MGIRWQWVLIGLGHKVAMKGFQVAMGSHRNSLKVAMGSHRKSFKVAMGSHRKSFKVAIGSHWEGFKVAMDSQGGNGFSSGGALGLQWVLTGRA